MKKTKMLLCTLATLCLCACGGNNKSDVSTPTSKNDGISTSESFPLEQLKAFFGK